MTSRGTPPRQCASSATFSAPIPCSALKLPPRPTAISWTWWLISSQRAEECRAVCPGGLGEIEVDIAVAQVAEGDDSDPRDQLPDGGSRQLEEALHAGDGHGNVVLDAGALLLLRLRHAVPEAPERVALGTAGRHDAVADQAGLLHPRQELLHLLVQRLHRRAAC